MKDRSKEILMNGMPYGLGFFALAFALSYFPSGMDIFYSAKIAFAVGTFALLVNGLPNNRFIKPVSSLENIWIETNHSELILIECPANHRVDELLVAGKLVLTDQRLLFASSDTDDRTQQTYTWLLADLQTHAFYSSIWNPGGEFLLRTRDGTILMFEVNEMKPWRDYFKGDKSGGGIS